MEELSLFFNNTTNFMALLSFNVQHKNGKGTPYKVCLHRQYGTVLCYVYLIFNVSF
jgi:hypothetical protein